MKEKKIINEGLGHELTEKIESMHNIVSLVNEHNEKHKDFLLNVALVNHQEDNT